MKVLTQRYVADLGGICYSNELAQVKCGVKMGEGDGTVSLLSLGAMCVKGWQMSRWNPAGIKVTTVEVRHSAVTFMVIDM